jgi:hypothetical protein
MAGTVEAGKSLTQKLITAILGGRAAKAVLFLQGRTDFNSELFGAEHLMLEDENASTAYAARTAFSSSIKSITSNQLQPCHGKGRDIINLSPWWRVTISLNDRPERMLVLPSLDDDIAGKIILLRATAHKMPMAAETPEEKGKFWDQLTGELPAFLYWLVNEYEIPAEWRNTRFGVKEWHHPTLLGELEELSPAIRLLELIDRLKPWGKVVRNGRVPRPSCDRFFLKMPRCAGTLKRCSPGRTLAANICPTWRGSGERGSNICAISAIAGIKSGARCEAT